MKELLMQKEVIWFIVGLVLLLLEFIFPGLVLIFFGIGAWITSILAYLFDLNIDTQLVIFIISSLISLAALRKLLKEKYMDVGNDEQNHLAEDFVGKQATAISSFKAGERGKVEFRGSNWEATSNADIEEGQSVIITGIDSIKLIVTTV
tara:strand:+ start:1189 stop:1635 length:447 start_codon:yes stop_codon:yes gene_type:complete